MERGFVMKIIIAIVMLSLSIMGCSPSNQFDEQAKAAIEDGRVVNWRAPALDRLERALATCDIAQHRRMNASQCAARNDEFNVVLRAKVQCEDWVLPSCDRSLGIISASLAAFRERLIRHPKPVIHSDFEWHRSPANLFLEAQFGIDDRAELIMAAVRKHVIVLLIDALLIGAVLAASIDYRRRLEQIEARRMMHRARSDRIRLRQQQVEAEAEKRRHLARVAELQIAEKKLALEKFRADQALRQSEEHRRTKRSKERQRILRMFGELDDAD